MIRYPISLTPDDNDTFLVTSPDLPEVTTFGDIGESCLENARNAVAEAVAARLSTFEDIPQPSGASPLSVAIDTQLSIKVRLKWAMDSQGVSRAELMRRTNLFRPQIDRMFDPNHSSRMDQYDQAFSALGMSLDIDVLPATSSVGFTDAVTGEPVEIDPCNAVIASISRGDHGTTVIRFEKDAKGKFRPEERRVREGFYYVADRLARATRVLHEAVA